MDDEADNVANNNKKEVLGMARRTETSKRKRNEGCVQQRKKGAGEMGRKEDEGY